MTLRTFFAFLSIALLCEGHPTINRESKYEKKHVEKKDISFEFFHLAQFWPPTSCYIYFGHERCKGIPQNVTGWTIHGLWPSRHNSELPQYCNDSLKFDYNKIKPLASLLATQWPSLETSVSKTHLWQHEWVKHGTCSQSVPRLHGELNYFMYTMILHKQIDVFTALKNHKIVPSSSIKYKPADIYWAVVEGVGTDPNIVCSYDKDTQKHYIDQIWICFTKEFLLMDCPDVSSHQRGNDPHPLASRFSQCPSIAAATLLYLPLQPAPHSQVETHSHKAVASAPSGTKAEQTSQVESLVDILLEDKTNMDLKFESEVRSARKKWESVVHSKMSVQEILRRL